MDVAELQEALAMERDHPVVVNFWATWCKPCVTELPYFLDLEKEYANQGLQVWLVSLDFAENTMADFLEEKGIESTAIFLTDGLRDPDWIGEINDSWSGAIPATLALHPNGSQLFHEGSLTKEALSEWLQLLLN